MRLYLGKSCGVVQRLVHVTDKVQKPHQVVRLYPAWRFRLECRGQYLDLRFCIWGKARFHRCAILTDWRVHEMPVFMQILVAVAEIFVTAKGRRLVSSSRPICLVTPVAANLVL